MPGGLPRGPKWMGPAKGGKNWDDDSLTAPTDATIAHARREAQAFLLTLFAGKESGAVGGRDPRVLIILHGKRFQAGKLIRKLRVSRVDRLSPGAGPRGKGMGAEATRSR